MKCPLQPWITTDVSGHEQYLTSDCIDDACAWWSRSMKRCSVQNIAFDVFNVAETLGRIADNMPYKPRI